MHLLVNFPPIAAVSRLVNCRKGKSSCRLRHESPGLRGYDWWAMRLWAVSYFAGSAADAPITTLRQHFESEIVLASSGPAVFGIALKASALSANSVVVMRAAAAAE